MLSSFDFLAFSTSRSDVVHFLSIDFLALMKLLHIFFLALTRLFCIDFSTFAKLFYIDLLAFAGLHTFFFIIIIVISQKKFLECWCIFIVDRQVGNGFAFIILKNPKIFYLNNLVLLFDMHPINCVIIIAN